MRWFGFALAGALVLGLLNSPVLAQGFGGGYRGTPTIAGLGAADDTAFGVESPPDTACTATGTDAVCIGDGAVAGDAAGDNAVLAIGARSTATGADSIAIGENTDATGAGSVAIGGSTTDGSSADATALDAIAIGRAADATGTNSIAIGGNSVDGNSADATAADTIAIGNNSLADGAQGTAVGVNADAGGVSAVAIGDTANASSGDAIAIGTNSVASTGLDAIAIGQNADATGANSIAIGGSSTDANSADATGTNSIAVGLNSLASATDSLAFGVIAEATSGVASIAIGRSTDASGANCIAIGGNATDTDSADCSAASSVAIGQHVVADDVGSFAFAAVEFSSLDTKRTIYHLVIQTTDATQTELSTDNAAAGAANDISVASDCGVTVDVLVHARQTNADGFSAGYRVLAVLDNNAGTTALVGTASTTTIGEDVGGWDVTITADDTNDGVNVLVTGAAGDSVNWSAFAEVILSCG